MPKAFAQLDDGEQVVRLTVSEEMVEDSPTFKEGELDRQAAAAHYGLAEADDEPSRTTRPGARSRTGCASGVEPAAERARGEPRWPGARCRGRPIIPPDPHDPL